jgi:RNA polymerase sigma factor (sigma-70 family)
VCVRLDDGHLFDPFPRFRAQIQVEITLYKVWNASQVGATTVMTQLQQTIVEPEHPIGRLFCRCLAEPQQERDQAEFYERSRPLFLSIATRVARRYGGAPADDIEDQMQDVRLRLSTQTATIARRQLDEPAAAQAYVAAVARNVVRDTWKSRKAHKRAVQLLPLFEADGQSGCGQLADTEFRILVNQLAMRFGSARDRRVFLLYFQFGYTASEIAAHPGIGLRVKGVESLLSRLSAESRAYVQGFPGALRISMESGARAAVRLAD